ncbi:hypothetical protein LUW77_24130 [Streptomyces radiopugnans]|nr:hypothetical protein LUW77_24130 [Streptomyces radiopugnans]
MTVTRRSTAVFRSGASRSRSGAGSLPPMRGAVARSPSAATAPTAAISQNVARQPKAPPSHVPSGTPVNSAAVMPAVTTPR